jgi:hypothetical protein
MLEAERSELRQAVREAIEGDFRRAHMLAAAYREPGTSFGLLPLDHASAAARQELRWATGAMRRAAADVERAAGALLDTRSDTRPAVGAIVPNSATPQGVAAELALYHITLAQEHLARTLHAEAASLDGASALLGQIDADVESLRSALLAALDGDHRPAAAVAEASGRRARQILALAGREAGSDASGARQRIAAAAAELALWAEQGQVGAVSQAQPDLDLP